MLFNSCWLQALVELSKPVCPFSRTINQISAESSSLPTVAAVSSSDGQPFSDKIIKFGAPAAFSITA
jgi:hypothetical protein